MLLTDVLSQKPCYYVLSILFLQKAWLLKTDPDFCADYNEVKYNVVANPRLVFSMNTFLKFNISFLEFPGAK
jgi:hypothetical protein